MCSDFIFSVAIFKEWDDSYDEDNQLNERKDKLIKIIKEATPSQIQEYFNNKDDIEERDLTIIGNKNIIIKVIEDFFGCLHSREVSFFIHKGERLYLTGGMSCGDSPTDALSYFYEFENIGSELLNRVSIE